MRIAQIAPLTESVPPKLYGGTERVIAYLVDELSKQDHAVTLFASGDSRTAATLVPVCPEALRLGNPTMDPVAWHVLMLEQVVQRAAEFDVIHFHIAPWHYPVASRLQSPHLATLHGRLDLPELVPLHQTFSALPVVSISEAQRHFLPHANWLGTVYHGLPPEQFRFRARPDGYLAFLGRISPEKRVDRAIAIARACGWPLRIAAKIDAVDRAYFERDIRPLLDDPLVDFVGEIGDSEKSDFLGGARALLFPIDWPEPFGLVMIEALACGTPVVAFRGGSVPEIIDHGTTGFIVETVEHAIEATRRIDEIDRARCRAVFDERFAVSRMAADYVRLYQQLADGATSNRVA
jgi:glycosyltransferase involved in cell wall biosynthesis